jgi:predicted amidohydrolase YtcJ
MDQPDGSMMVFNGRIFTGRRFVESILISGGRVVYAGSSREAAEKSAGQGIESLDAEGRIVLPGLVDSHMHLLETGIEMKMGTLKGYASIESMVSDLRDKCRKMPFLISGGWDEENFREHRLPERKDLDRISTDSPVMLFRFCHHVVSVNSFVIEKLGLEDAEDVEGGIVGRDASGRLNGILIDRAIDYVHDYSSELQQAIAADAMCLAADYAISRGITTLMPLACDALEFQRCAELVVSKRIKCRLRLFLSKDTFSDYLVSGTIPENDMFRVAGIKLFADGSFGGRTALLSEPYEDSRTCGLSLMDIDELTEELRKAAAAGKMAAVHAIGDKAIANVLEAASNAQIRSDRLRIEHLALTPPEIVKRLSELRPLLVVQPHFLVGDWWLPARLGERAKHCYLFRTFVDMGLEPVGSSDSPVEPLDPWTGILSATDRGNHAGVEMSAITSSEAVTTIDAIKMYTAWSGKASNEAGMIGSLEAGGYGDFIMMEEKDLDATLRNSRVLRSYVGGRLIFAAD